MTATLPDDSVLVTHFNAAPETLAAPITPRTAGDLGDRMILTPLETHPGIGDQEVKRLLSELALEHNVVVIVPSKRRAELWRDTADAVHDKNSIESGVADLRKGHVGLVVLINKYDGIDLPGDACRVLAIDGLPESYGELERLDALALSETDAFVNRQIQRIEQGMGRGVRSNDDWCAVLLLGSRLTERLYRSGASSRFSPATQAQLDLSRLISEQLRGQPIGELKSAIVQCLDREPDWVAASRSALDGVEYEAAQPVSDVSVAQRQALSLAAVGQYGAAAGLLETAANGVSDARHRGWLKAQTAGYRHMDDPVVAQKMLTSALADNRAITKPRVGVEYQRMSAHADQAEQCVSYLTKRYSDSTALTVGFAAFLDDLRPVPETTSQFEQGWMDLGLHLGLACQRPERDQGAGPDVLWMLGGNAAAVTECKSGVVTDFIAKHDAAQLSHSVDWFRDQYDPTYKPRPLMIHKTNVLHAEAAGREGMRVITFPKLEDLRTAVMSFASSIAGDSRWRDVQEVGDRLSSSLLTANQIFDSWTVSPKKS